MPPDQSLSAADGEKVHAGSQRGAACRALPPSTALIHFCCTLCQIQSNPFLHRISPSSLSELEVANLAPLTLIIAYEKYCQTAYYSRVTTSHSDSANKLTVCLSLKSLFSMVTSPALFYQTDLSFGSAGLFIMFNLPNNTHLAKQLHFTQKFRPGFSSNSHERVCPAVVSYARAAFLEKAEEQTRLYIHDANAKKLTTQRSTAKHLRHTTSSRSKPNMQPPFAKGSCQNKLYV